MTSQGGVPAHFTRALQAVKGCGSSSCMCTDACSSPSLYTPAPPISSLFSFTSPAVKRLLGWKQGDEEEKWASGGLFSEEVKEKKKEPWMSWRGLSCPGQPSKCVTIPRSLGGLQVSTAEYCPMSSTAGCGAGRTCSLTTNGRWSAARVPIRLQAEEVCINPYHYRRVEAWWVSFMV